MSETTDTEVVEEARDLLKTHERNEMMDASLDIIATTTKQQAKSALKKARADLNALDEARDEALLAWRDARLDAAQEILYNMDVTEKIIAVIDALADMELDPGDVWDEVRVNEDANGETYLVAESIINFDASWVEGSTITAISSEAGYKRVMDLSEYPAVGELEAALDDATKKRDAAKEAVKEARYRVDNHQDLVDASRVQLQRQKLEQMGEGGADVLDRVDNLLETQKEGDYLSLL